MESGEKVGEVWGNFFFFWTPQFLPTCSKIFPRYLSAQMEEYLPLDAEDGAGNELDVSRRGCPTEDDVEDGSEGKNRERSSGFPFPR